MKEISFKIVPANNAHVNDICHLLIRSIKEICAPDYQNDETIIEEWLANKTPQNVQKWISTSSHALVALNSNKSVIGFGLMSQHGEIYLNYILPEYLYKGIGKALLNSMEKIAREHNIRQITAVSTITAKDFYKRNGFVKNGDPEYVGKNLGEFPLKKILW